MKHLPKPLLFKFRRMNEWAKLKEQKTKMLTQVLINASNLQTRLTDSAALKKPSNNTLKDPKGQRYSDQCYHLPFPDLGSYLANSTPERGYTDISNGRFPSNQNFRKFGNCGKWYRKFQENGNCWISEIRTILNRNSRNFGSKVEWKKNSYFRGRNCENLSIPREVVLFFGNFWKFLKIAFIECRIVCYLIHCIFSIAFIDEQETLLCFCDLGQKITAREISVCTGRAIFRFVRYEVLTV